MKAPLNPDDETMLKIPAQSELDKLVQMARLLVMDEATLLDNRQLAALDRTLCDLMGCTEPFGGKVLVLSGDLRQCLPVVPGASRAGIVERCINKCALWQNVQVMELTKNMRVLTSNDQHLKDWDTLITSIGNGTFGTPTDADMVKFPSVMCIKIEENTAKDKNRESKSMKQLAARVFPGLKDNICVSDWLDGRAILTPTNKAVDGINDMIVADLPGGEIRLNSADQVDDIRDSRGFSMEYMNGLTPNGMPRHCIALKPGVPLMLMRNLEPKNGLCNGSRLIFRYMSRNNRLMICSHNIHGVTREVAIPRIVLKPKDNEFLFDWSRRQFPVRVAFACTINKSQGQTMK
jgi:ATP-dependent DNA helicase PIF1